MSKADITAIILAAGMGKRMNSTLPKVLHPLHGKPMLAYVLDAAKKSDIKNICLVLGPDTAPFDDFLSTQTDLTVCIQHNRLGTGDAVAAAAWGMDGVITPYYARGEVFRGDVLRSEYCLICYGDVPAISASLLKDFIQTSISMSCDVSLIAMNQTDPSGYGRILVDDLSQVRGIVEDKDASEEQRAITLCNTGIVLAKTKLLFDLLNDLTADNSQSEYYLTDIFGLAYNRGLRSHCFATEDAHQFDGVNTIEQLRAMELRTSATELNQPT